MEIRDNNAGSGGSSKIDITKTNRDRIRERNPSPPAPKPVTGADVQGDGNAAKRIANARDRFEAAASVHKRIHAARARHRAEAPEDRLTFSTEAQKLVETSSTTRQEADLRAQRVSELQQLTQRGQLDASGLVSEAARRMLGGE